jgi:hypothetical protein
MRRNTALTFIKIDNALSVPCSVLLQYISSISITMSPCSVELFLQQEIMVISKLNLPRSQSRFPCGSLAVSGWTDQELQRPNRECSECDGAEELKHFMSV